MTHYVHWGDIPESAVKHESSTDGEALDGSPLFPKTRVSVVLTNLRDPRERERERRDRRHGGNIEQTAG